MKLSLDEKIRLFNGQGNWKTFNAGGKIPQITMSDGPHGLRKQDEQNYGNINSSRPATCFPTGSAIASSWSRKSLRKLGTFIAREAKSKNVNLMLGPGINIKRNPLCGRNFEYYSEDPLLAGILAENYIAGMQSEGIGSCLKHFALNNQETLRQVSNSICDARTLNEIYLKAFEIAVKNSRPAAIMESYNLVNGKPVCQNKTLLTSILKEKWSFQGPVISDWGACLDPAECIKAGMDLAMPDSHGYFERQISSALKNGILTEEDLDKANERVIKLAEKLSAPSKKLAISHEKLLEENSLNALELAEQCAVLLKNEDFLPLSKESSPEIAVTGIFAEKIQFQGGGSSHINCKKTPDVLEALKNHGFKILYEPGFYEEKGSRKLFNRAVKLVQVAARKNLPVLFFTALPHSVEGEGFDRKNLNLPEFETELLEKILEITENVAVINFSGAPVSIPQIKKAKAFLQMYLSGQESGQAAANLITGKAVPQGKLCETWPLNAEDLPSRITGELNVPYNEGVFTGYRYYETLNKPVFFEFGAGLSYTEFEYSNLEIKKREENSGTKITVDFKIKNTGKIPAFETFQIYVMPAIFRTETRLLRPAAELKAFDKIYLEAGEEKKVSVELDESAFTVFSPITEKFEVIEGQYKICVNSSVKNIRLSEKIMISGAKIESVLPEKTNFFCVEEFPEKFFIKPHKKGFYTVQDNLKTLAKTSVFSKILIFIFSTAIRCMNFGKSRNDPAVKIAVNAITENPLESLISTSGGMIGEKFTRLIVKIANGR